MDQALLKLELKKYLVIANFLLESLEARKEPVDLRGILFSDNDFSHEELVASVNNLAHHAVKEEPIYNKHELQQLLQHVREECDKFRAQLAK